MKKIPSFHPTENFISALALAATFEPLEVGKEYKYRKYTGVRNYTVEKGVCSMRHIRTLATQLYDRGEAGSIPYVKDGKLLRMEGKVSA